MLDRIFVMPRTVDRVRALWLGPAIDRYAAWMVERRMSPMSCRIQIAKLIRFDRFARARGVREWRHLPSHVDAFVASERRRYAHRCRTIHGRRCVESIARAPVERTLRLVLPDYVGTVRRRALPFANSAPGFFDHLQRERGLRPSTIHAHECVLRQFERFLVDAGCKKLSRLSAPIVSRFLTTIARRVTPGSVRDYTGVVRKFLRYLNREGVLDADLGATIPRGRVYKQARIPRAIPWAEVQRVVESVDRRSRIGKRDYAILLLLATYGLRAHDVATLKLQDIDWKNARLNIVARKAGNSTAYPLAANVGDALVTYLKHARPDSDNRQVFLNTTAPFAPISAATASNRATHFLQAAGVKIARPGSHTFRHSCVQRLVEADVPFKVIGDYVGHRTPSATQVYAKVAVHKLRLLAIEAAEDVL